MCKCTQSVVDLDLRSPGRGFSMECQLHRQGIRTLNCFQIFQTNGTLSKKSEPYLTTTIAIGVAQYVILGIKSPEGVVLRLSRIAKRINCILNFVLIPFEWRPFVQSVKSGLCRCHQRCYGLLLVVSDAHKPFSRSSKILEKRYRCSSAPSSVFRAPMIMRVVWR